jgi:DNA-binding phage protein
MLMCMRFKEWLSTQPHGTMMRICRDTGLGLRTIYAVRDGVNTPRFATAKRISEATGGAVTIEDLCEPQEATS